jgi:actin-like ATPase involved in cell morphogenesis
MAKSLREKHPEENLHILVAKRNSGSFTYDGIELGGERVCQEIEEEIEKLAKAGQEIKRISLVGKDHASGMRRRLTSSQIVANFCRISQALQHLISVCGPLFVDGIIIFGTFWVRGLSLLREGSCLPSTTSARQVNHCSRFSRTPSLYSLRG